MSDNAQSETYYKPRKSKKNGKSKIKVTSEVDFDNENLGDNGHSQEEVVQFAKEDLTTTTHEADVNLNHEMKAVHDIKLDTESIGRFLRIPYKLDRFVTDNTSSFQEIVDYDLPFDVLKDNNIWREKLAGYTGFRGTFVFKFLITCPPHVAGQLLVSFLPSFADGIVLRDTQYNSLVMKSQRPSMVITLGETKEAIFKVPYRSPYPFYDFVKRVGAWGQLSLNYLTFVRGPAGENANIQVFTYMEDLELGPPGLREIALNFGNSAVGIVSESGVETKKKTKAVTEQETHTPIISTTLSYASKIAGVLSGVPMLSTIAKPAQWLLNMGSNVAAALGYGQPIVQPEFGMYVQGEHMQFHHHDYPLYCQKISHSAQQMHEIKDFMGTNGEDEMVIRTLVQKFTHLESIPWASSEDSGTVLFSIQCCPVSMYRKASTPVRYEMAPCALIGGAFRYWRGGFKFRVSIPKTQFHIGRLRFFFSRTLVSENQARSFDQLIPMNQCFVDIGTGYQFEIVAPWVSNTSYLSTYEPMGYIYCVVEDPLQAPEICAPAVDVRIEVAMLEDAEFQMLQEPVWYPCSGLTSQSIAIGTLFNRAQPPILGVVSESGLQTNIGKDKEIDTMQLGTSCNADPMGPARFCFGERMLSLKQLMQVPITYQNSIANSRAHQIWLWTSTTSDDASAGSITPMMDWVSFVSCLFAFRSGSIMFSFAGNQIDQLAVSNTTAFSNSANATGHDGFSPQAYVKRDISTQSNISFPLQGKLPYFYVSQWNILNVVNDLEAYGEGAIGYGPAGYQSSPDPFQNGFRRKAGDDYTCGYYIGTPNCCLLKNEPLVAITGGRFLSMSRPAPDGGP